jgi:hypothetical protein
MPHQCTECGRVFPDGSKEMLTGCPDCGGNTFQFKPADDAAEEPPSGDASPPEPPGSDSTVAETVSRATRTVREWVTDSDGPDPVRDRDSDPSVRPGGTTGSPSDGATAEAGSSPDGTAEAGSSPGERTPGDDADRPDLSPSADADYPEWPNPDGADTSGVGKGPSARRERESERPVDSTTGSDRTAQSTDSDAPAAEPDHEPAERPRGETAADEFEWTDDPAPGDSADESSVGSSVDPDWNTDGIRARTEDREDDAQASARSDVVSPDELPGPTAAGGAGPDPSPGPESEADPSTPPVDHDDDTASTESPDEPGPSRDRTPVSTSESAGPSDGRVVDTPSDEGRPDLDDLRQELNDQFESIKIVSPGQYELNLMELYDRDEYIISLREDGRYVIEVAESWRQDE